MAEVDMLSALLRKDLTAFIEKVFHTVNPGAAFLPNWHIEALSHALQEHGAGTGGRAIVTMPPRALKSICASVAYPAWMLGHDPGLKFICVSYSSELARELSSQFRMVVNSGWYRELFPNTRESRDTSEEWTTTRGGGRLATSVKGTIRGRGADVIIIDDPLKGGDDNSETERQHVINWYGTTLSSRLNNKQTGSIMLVMQRLHEDDLAGHLMSGGGWHVLDLPAIADEDQHVPLGNGNFHTFSKGDLLHPELLPQKVLDQARADMGSRAFSAQYLQRPVPAEGNIVRRAWLDRRRYEAAPQMQPGRQVVQSWDLASTISEASDYSVGLTFIVEKQDYYLIDVFRQKMEYPALKRRIIEHARLYGANTLLIEDAGPGQHMLQELRTEQPLGVPRPIGIKPDTDKTTRMEAAASRIEAGQLLLPREAPWLAEFEHELLAFPQGRRDDQVDALSQFLNWTVRFSRRTRVPAGPIVVGVDTLE